MNFIVITVMLTAVCTAFLFAHESDEISKEIEKEKPRAKRPLASASGISAAIGASWADRHNERMYQWNVRHIQPDGKINLERYTAKADAADVRTGEVR